jgi:DNA-binding LacI/PurR family transcriptional regulator
MSEPQSFKKLTLNDVARRLGVSRATVSNAFNKPELLAKDMLERIKTAALELGYFGPDPMARAMRRKDLHEVAVVFHHDLRYALSDPVSVEFLLGVATELDARRLALHLIPQTGRRGDLDAAFQTTADALIIHDEVVADLIPQLRAVRKPLSVVDTHVDGLPSVQIEDRLGAAKAMDHVLGKKPDHILVLCMPLDADVRAMTQYTRESTTRAHVSAERVAGYLDSLNRSGFDRKAVTWMEVNEKSPETAALDALPFLQPLLRSQRVCVVGMTDRMVLSVLRGLDDCDWNKPVGMVGFDDIPEAARRGLSTVRQNAYEKGVFAVRAALDRIGSVCLPTELVVRDT